MEMTINSESESNEVKQSGDALECDLSIKRPLEELDADLNKKLKSTPELSCVSEYATDVLKFELIQQIENGSRTDEITSLQTTVV